jgi:hypothetical protein
MTTLQFFAILSIGLATAFQSVPHTAALEALHRSSSSCSSTSIYYRSEVADDTLVRHGWIPWKKNNHEPSQEDKEQSAVDDYLVFLDRRYK